MLLKLTACCWLLAVCTTGNWTSHDSDCGGRLFRGEGLHQQGSPPLGSDVCLANYGLELDLCSTQQAGCSDSVCWRLDMDDTRMAGEHGLVNIMCGDHC